MCSDTYLRYTVIYDGSGIGNITSKTDVGNYDYTAGVHNVASISDPTTLMQNLPKQAIEYTKFNKVSYIRDSTATLQARELFLTYGPDQQRVKTVYKIDNVVNKTKYFALGQYEKDIPAASNFNRHTWVCKEAILNDTTRPRLPVTA